ncbi:MAG: cobalamin-dependent protein, partial [Caldilineales bacterium]|nr:cobalamin-dependent protein [Caldilineales bacterium]
GFEVIYTGIRQTPDMIAEAALQEDVDVVGLSILSGAHMALVPKVQEALRRVGREDVLLLVGGIIPDEDIPILQQMGVKGVFGPGTPTSAIAEFIRRELAEAEPVA